MVAIICQPLAQGRDVHREVESEGSRRHPTVLGPVGGTRTSLGTSCKKSWHNKQNPIN